MNYIANIKDILDENVYKHDEDDEIPVRPPYTPLPVPEGAFTEYHDVDDIESDSTEVDENDLSSEVVSVADDPDALIPRSGTEYGQ